jgi:hypothetical protein
MRLEPLYRIRFTYPESWVVGLDGGWQQLFFIAEGRCEGAITDARSMNRPASPEPHHAAAAPECAHCQRGSTCRS